MRYWLLSALLSFLSISTLFAQAPPAAPDYPRFYMGVLGMQGNYAATYPRIGSYEEGVLSPALTFGYQFASRAAVQISAERSRDKLYIDFFDQTPAGKTIRIGNYRENHQHFAVPIILRLTGTKRSYHKLQFDALAGLVILNSSYNRIFEDFNEQQQTTSYRELAEQTTNVALSIGGGIRYRFGRRIEAVADANLNRTIGAAATSGFVNVYTVGLRYRFGFQ